MFTVRRSVRCLFVFVTVLALASCCTTAGSNGVVVVTADTGVDAQVLPDGTDQPPLDTVSTDGASDASSGSDAVGDAGLDAEADVPADVPVDVSACTGAGCPCKTDSQCDSAFCLDDGGGKVCAAACTDVCPAGYACSAGGAGKICKPAFGRLCEPCTQDADCVDGASGTGACVAYKSGASLIGNFCGGGKCDARRTRSIGCATSLPRRLFVHDGCQRRRLSAGAVHPR